MASNRLTALEMRVDELIISVRDLRERLDAHISNHHSRLSAMKQGGIMGVTLSLVYLLVELLRRFAL